MLRDQTDYKDSLKDVPLEKLTVRELRRIMEKKLNNEINYLIANSA